MKAITIRNLPPALAELLERRAKEDHTSLNQTAIKLMEKGAGLDKSAGPPYRDLDWFFGSWTKEQADEFDEFLRNERQVDPRDWE